MSRLRIHFHLVDPDRANLTLLLHRGEDVRKLLRAEMHLIDPDYEERAGAGDLQQAGQRNGSEVAVGEGSGAENGTVAVGDRIQSPGQVDLVQVAIELFILPDTFSDSRFFGACILAYMDRLEEARNWAEIDMRKLEARVGTIRIEHVGVVQLLTDNNAFRTPEDIVHFAEGMRIAGVPG